MMMNVAALVILYQPQENVVTNISSYIDKVDRLYVYDNSKENSALKYFENRANVEYIHDGENRGISERLNTGCRKAIKDGFRWILTMDQDTFFSERSINYYLNSFENYSEKEKTAVVATKYSWDDQASTPDSIIEESVDAITSGMLLNLDIWQKLNGFDEALFIDSVDTEYCLRASLKGYKIIIFANIYILHEIGIKVYRSSIKSLYTYRKKKVIHSAIRCYYMYRNMLYLLNKYEKDYPDFCKHLHTTVNRHVKVCLYYGGHLLRTLLYIQQAKRDFRLGKMGKIKR
jgi:rhamnosyltransferase